MGKKSKQDDESEDIEEGTNPSHQTDATGPTDVAEDDGTEAENNSLIYKLKKKIQSLQKGKSKAKADDEDEEKSSPDEDAEALKKKKKSKIIQFVIVGGLVVFVAYDYIFPPEEPVAQIKLGKKGPRGPKKPVLPTEEKPATDTTAATDTPVTDPATVTPAESPVDVTEAPGDTTTTPVETAPTDTTVTETPTDTSTTPEETAPTDTTVTETPTEPVETTPVETAPVENTVTDTPSDDTGTGEATTPGEDNLTDQILEDLEKQAKDTQQPEQKKEYVAPPDYEYRGRGLVYNCSGKHWACVDAPSYKTCEDNASSVKYLNKKTECHPFNVYETTKGCEGVQNQMVSSSAKTAFCAE
jgi:hypothetical protein